MPEQQQVTFFFFFYKSIYNLLYNLPGKNSVLGTGSGFEVADLALAKAGEHQVKPKHEEEILEEESSCFYLIYLTNIENAWVFQGIKAPQAKPVSKSLQKTESLGLLRQTQSLKEPKYYVYHAVLLPTNADR